MATRLILRQNDDDYNLMKWLEERGEAMYPEIGVRTWRVPPVRFNVQKMREVKDGKKGTSVVLDLPAQTDQESSYVENLVFSAFEKLSESIELERIGKPLFLITNFEYDNYLNKLDLTAWMKTKNNSPDPTDGEQVSMSQREYTTDISDATSGQEEKPQVKDEDLKRRCCATSWLKLPDQVAKRGELDGLVLSEEAGLILLQIKAVGYNFETTHEGTLPQKYLYSIEKAVEKAGRQLLRDRMVMSYIMDDVQLQDRHMIFVVALPNLTRRTFNLALDSSSALKDKIENEFCLNPETSFLFAEEFQQDKGCYSNLHKWWTDKLLNKATPQGFDLEIMKRIIFRTVGLLSTVSVWAWRQPRSEVRTLDEATWETGCRYAQMVLSTRQVELLKREDQFLYIWGAAGSGKTLLLSLKGRSWQRKNCRVVIINSRLGTKGREVGQVIERTVNSSEDEAKAKRVDHDLMDDPSLLKEELSAILEENRPIKFILDEVTWLPQTVRLLEYLKSLSENVSIWCAGMLEEFRPPGFNIEHISQVLRCPPSVQRLLRVVDNREERKQRYNTTSARAGLSTDGPEPFFVIHSAHNGKSSVLPYDCSTCAHKVVAFLKEHLKLSYGGSSSAVHSSETDIHCRIRSFSLRESTHKKQLSQDISKDRLKSSHHRGNMSPRCGSFDEGTDTNKEVDNFLKRLSSSAPGISSFIYYDDDFGACSQTDVRQDKGKAEGQVLKRKKSRKKGTNRSSHSSSGQPSDDVADSGSSCHGKQCVKSKRKLDFSDVVMPVTMPIPWHHYNELGYYSISSAALAQNMHLMGSSIFCTTLLEADIPVRIERGMRCEKIPESPDNVLTMCPIGMVHGLEYKVVICMPNFCAVKETTEFNEGIFHAQIGPWTKMKRTSFGDELVVTHPVFEESSIKESKKGHAGEKQKKAPAFEMITGTRNLNALPPLIDEIRISTHVEGPSTDVLYSRQEDHENTSLSNSQKDHKHTFTIKNSQHNKQVISDVNTPPSNGGRDSGTQSAKESPSGMLQQTGTDTLSSQKLQEEPIKSSPSVVSSSAMGVTSSGSSYALSTSPSSSVTSTQSSSTPTQTAGKSFSSDQISSPTFLPSNSRSSSYQAPVPGSDSRPEICPGCLCQNCVCGFKEIEVQALNQLNEWDKAYVLLCASRCTAQLIMVLP